MAKRSEKVLSLTGIFRVKMGSFVMALGALVLIAYAIILFVNNLNNNSMEFGMKGIIDKERTEIRDFSPKLMQYITHLHFTVSILIAAAGLAAIGLALYGVRTGQMWAWGFSILTWAFAVSVPFFVLAVTPYSVYENNIDKIGYFGLVYIATGVFVIGALIALAGLLTKKVRVEELR